MSRSGNLPNLIIIGAMKSGTTSLHYYLNLHPEIFMSRQKELDFFNKEKNWSKGIEWYRSHFVGQAKIYGESSPNYTNYLTWEDTPSRMFALIPNAKLIYVVRDPVERIISHYVHFYAARKENRSIEDALAKLEENPYVERSRYFWQLQQYLAWFSPANILVITSEELLNFPEQTMQQVFQFLGVDDNFKFEFDLKRNATDILRFGHHVTNSNFKFNTKLHDSSRKKRVTIAPDSVTAKTLSRITQLLPSEIRVHAKRVLYLPFSQKLEKPIISDELRQKLIDFLAEDINQLKTYTGRNFEEWNLQYKDCSKSF